MKESTARKVADVGIAINVAAGHVGEMVGRAAQAAGKATGCPIASTVGKATEAAGKAWGSTAIEVGNRDAGRMGNK